MRNTADREIFHQGLSVMQQVKQSIMELRELIAKSKEIVEANEGDNEDIQNFYRQEIANAQNVVKSSKENAWEFITSNKKAHPEAMAIFENEYNSLPV